MESPATPHPLSLIEEFINTRGPDADELSTRQQLQAWLAGRELAPAGATVDEAELARATSVREGLRALIAENNAPPVDSPRPDGLDPHARSDLAGLVAELPLVLDIGGPAPRLVPRPGLSVVDAALATLVAAVPPAVADGTWTRLKACREPSCRWAFYDHSRNRSRSWCSMGLCGNRAKGRAFYHRNQ